jgi:hypothetical protein
VATSLACLAIREAKRLLDGGWLTRHTWPAEGDRVLDASAPA